MTALQGPPRPVSNLAPRSFSAVDASGQVDDHAAYLERAAARVADKREGWFDLLQLEPGAMVLDAGSGMGEVVRLLAARVAPGGRAVGVDLSAELVERSRARAVDLANAEYHLGDLMSLPFDDGAFDAAYSERVFMHLADPDQAMRELRRVLRPGGRLVIIDPDHTCAATDADDAELADLLTTRLTLAMANARSGRQLRSRAVLAGFTDVAVEAFARTLTDRDELRAVAPRPLEQRLEDMVAEGLLDADRAQAYVADQNRREAEGRFQVTTLFYVLTARR